MMDIDSVEIDSKDNESKKPRRTERKRKVVIFQNIDTFTKKRIRKEKIIVPPSPEDIRKEHVKSITNVFRQYISETLDYVDLTPDKEKTRVSGLIKNLNNAINLKLNAQ